MELTEAVMIIMVTGMTVGVPLLGLTLRFALKPVIETWLRVREVQARPAGELEALRARVAHLEYMLDRHGLLEHPVTRATPELGELPERLSPMVRVDRERV
ncbi:hypothetical protein HJC10_34975 [Corallococcus exiguus]|uniref:Uncharacterized protein n=1 Tax=Corallococcus exiguus TaxID=83462 RepID=A0A7X4YCU2_9BACT|nr:MULTISPECIES: hypothetical protein [Corallococcus]NBC42379.1 hypothetical protein [Corallococcus exiguus]NNB86873.1 hypothetical protein [Corallococcus exiguus]NNB94824.1 hypothetical protein [Corallococcus exiguus]NNC08028.1 hypothetical protein [Corallococcus exiguus]NPC52285.1 hypothetical protein [Corallococcus exiguus]